MGKVEDRRRRQAKFVKESPITLTPSDLARIFNVSNPTAWEDARYLLKNKLVPQEKIRSKNMINKIFGIK